MINKKNVSGGYDRILKKAFEILDQQLKVRGIEVIWDLEKDLPAVMAASNRLEQVFINLLINARDAIDEKWQTQPHQAGDKKINLKTSCSSREVIVEISDTGMGIADELLDRIFEPFFTTKKVGRGTGLGLSISYGIIQECKGNIQAVSHKGQGAGFIIKFPITTDN